MNEIVNDISLLVPEMQDKVNRLQTFLEYHRLPLEIFETKRTIERQKYLYSLNTKTRIITNCDGVIKKSPHQTGKAVDFVVKKNGKWIVEKNNVWSWSDKHEYYYKMFGALAEKLELIWGGDFSFKDYPHVQLK